MRPPKTPNGLEIDNDLLKDDLWTTESEPNTWSGFPDFGAHEPMPPNSPSDSARPNERAWSAPPFHGSTPTAYSLDNSQRVLSGEQEGVPNPVTIAGTTSTS